MSLAGRSGPREAGPSGERPLLLKGRTGALELSPSQRSATWKGGPLRLEPAEFNLLVILARHAQREAVAPHAVLLETIADPRSPGGATSPKALLKVQVSKLRRKLAGAGFSIEPVRGLGYRLNAVPWSRAPRAA